MSLPWGTRHGHEFFLWNVYMLVVMSLISGAFFEPADAAVLLSEICADPATDWNGDGLVDSRNDEWVEVINTGPGTVDLSAFYLRDALGDDPQIRLSGILEEGGTALFYGSDAVEWQSQQGLSVSGLSLNNSGDQVELHLGHPLDPTSQMVAVRLYEDHVAEDDRTTALFLPEGEWVLCDGLNPYSGGLDPVGTGCPPTPGEVNFCSGLVPNEDRSWSEIKRSWR